MKGELEHRYEVRVMAADGPQKIPDAVKAELRASGMMDDKGKISISPKMIRKMKREYVDCPVIGGRAQFIQCFVCPNFQSRVSGTVLCKGEALRPAGGQRGP